jgi:hypothetical protein
MSSVVGDLHDPSTLFASNDKDTVPEPDLQPVASNHAAIATT